MKERLAQVVVDGSGGFPGVPASVVMLIFELDGEPHLVFIRRVDRGRHPDQMAFPGGGMEPDDADTWQTALRELEEEVGCPSTGVERLGYLGSFTTWVTHIIVDVHVAWREEGRYDWVPDPREVVRVHEIPITWLTAQLPARPRREVYEPPEDLVAARRAPAKGQVVRDVLAEKRRWDTGFGPRHVGEIELVDFRPSQWFNFAIPGLEPDPSDRHTVIWGMTARITECFLREVWSRL